MSDNSLKIKQIRKQMNKEHKKTLCPNNGDIVECKTKYGKIYKCRYSNLRYFKLNTNISFSRHEILSWNRINND